MRSANDSTILRESVDGAGSSSIQALPTELVMHTERSCVAAAIVRGNRPGNFVEMFNSLATRIKLLASSVAKPLDLVIAATNRAPSSATTA